MHHTFREKKSRVLCFFVLPAKKEEYIRMEKQSGIEIINGKADERKMIVFGETP